MTNRNIGTLSERVRASGRRWRNAPPINAPAEKPTKPNKTLVKSLSLTVKVKTPAKESRLMKNVHPRTQSKMIMLNT
jgi:hypothetical protein